MYNSDPRSNPQKFAQDETRQGDRLTNGQFTVLLPDGRLQRVVYKVDGDSGFVADVTYERPARLDPPPRPYVPPPPPPTTRRPSPPPPPPQRPQREFGPVRFNPFG